MTATGFTPDMTVAEIVIANPATARVFERREIDYCCNGQRTLDAACVDAGIAPDSILDELELVETADSETPPSDDIGSLIGHIVVTHHTYLRRELPRLEILMGKVIDAHSTAHPELHEIASLVAELSGDLLPHLAKEEQILFPIAIQLLGAVEPMSFHCGSVTNPIEMMHVDHDRTGDLLATLRRRTNRYTPPDDACPTWRALYAGLADLEVDTHRHVHLENNLLFPAIADREARLGSAPADGP